MTWNHVQSKECRDGKGNDEMRESAVHRDGKGNDEVRESAVHSSVR